MPTYKILTQAELNLMAQGCKARGVEITCFPRAGVAPIAKAIDTTSPAAIYSKWRNLTGKDRSDFFALNRQVVWAEFYKERAAIAAAAEARGERRRITDGHRS